MKPEGSPGTAAASGGQRKEKKPFAAVLLAGGQSRRMGQDKALLRLPDGRRLWERQLAVLRELGPAELFISGPRRKGFPAEVTCLADEVPGRGPLGGVAAALQEMTGTSLVVLAVDLPAMTSAFLGGLAEACGAGETGIVPYRAGTGFYEPLAAVYPASCRRLAGERLRGEDWSLQGFVRAAGERVRHVEVRAEQEALFVNWNEAGGRKG